MKQNSLLPQIKSAPTIPEDWSYDESVKKVQGFIYKWRNITEELLTELWIAREKIKGIFEEYQKGGGTKVPPPPTWSGYCRDIGSSRQVVNRWLAAYEGKPKKLLDAPPPDLPAGKYFVLYADPPWKYQNTGFDESASRQ